MSCHLPNISQQFYLKYQKKIALINIKKKKRLATNFTLKHGQKREPHLQQRIIRHELQRHRSVGENIIQVGDQGPITVILHHGLPAVHNIVKILILI